MNSEKINLLLADDDTDDCDFFRDALSSLPVETTLTTVHNGVELMQLLSNQKANELPDGVFIDLNMPRKNGFECLTEIKLNEKLKQLPVIIFSTSFNKDVVNLLQQQGANHYIRKPGEFSKLKKAIHEAISNLSKNNSAGSTKENFVIQV